MRAEFVGHDKPEKEEGKGGSGWVGQALRESRTLLLSGEINDKSAREMVTTLLALDADDPEKPIIFIINSGGGSISSGFAIFDTMRMITAPVVTVGAGIVASMGVTLLLAPPKERRLSLPNTRYMIHQPLISGTMIAPASDIEISAREMVRLKEHLNRLIAQSTGQELARVEVDTHRDYWMNAEQAMEYGLVGGIRDTLAGIRG